MATRPLCCMGEGLIQMKPAFTGYVIILRETESFARQSAGSTIRWMYTVYQKGYRHDLPGKPDVVHLQCLNGYFINIYKLIAWLRDHRIPTVLTLHAEFMYTGNCGHSLDCERWKASCGHCAAFHKATGNYFFDRTRSNHRKMQKAFSTFNKNLIVVSVSPWLERRAKMSSILGLKEHSVIFNGVDTSIFAAVIYRICVINITHSVGILYFMQLQCSEMMKMI